MVAHPHAHSVVVAEGKWTVGTIRAVPGLANDGFMGVLAAAELLGVTNRTIYALIDEGALAAEITSGPKGRRVIRIHSAAIATFLDRSRVSPGELRDLYPPTVGGRYRSGPQRLTSSDPGP